MQNELCEKDHADINEKQKNSPCKVEYATTLFPIEDSAKERKIVRCCRYVTFSMEKMQT